MNEKKKRDLLSQEITALYKKAMMSCSLKDVRVQYVANPRGFSQYGGYVVRVRFDTGNGNQHTAQDWLKQHFTVIDCTVSEKTVKGSGFYGGRGRYNHARTETMTYSFWIGSVKLKDNYTL